MTRHRNPNPHVMTETSIGSPLGGLKAITFPEWMVDAPCADPRIDPEIFFPNASRGRGGAARMARRSVQAKAVCAGCPVRTECLAYALESDARHGVWGGLDEWERRELRTRPKRRA